MRRSAATMEEVARRRQAIIEAGFRQFAERSIDAVSMQNIADEVGLSFATMYRYFDTKLSLVVAIGAWKWGEVFRAGIDWTRSNAAAGLTGAELLVQYLDRFIAVYRNQPELLRFNQFFNIYIRHGECDPERLKPYMDMIDGVAERFHHIYERGVEDGTIRADIPEAAMFAESLHLMMAATTRYAVGLVYRPEGSDPERELVRLRDMMLREYTVRG